MSNTSNDFADTWGFPGSVKDTIAGAAYYDITVSPGTYRSGRQKFTCAFLDANRAVIESREAMELVSKKTRRPYHVVKRNPALPTAEVPATSLAARNAIAMTAAANSQFGLNDLYLP
jgi:hypothetical protein